MNSKNVSIRVIWALTRARNLTLTDSTDRSQAEEHLEFVPEFLLRTILQKRRLKCENCNPKTSKNISIRVIWALTRARNLTLSDSTDRS